VAQGAVVVTKEDVVKTWKTSTLLLATAIHAQVLLHPYGSWEVLCVEWPDGKGGSVSFGKHDIFDWFTAVAQEIDRRFAGGSP
jgi:hypothetical protein